MTGTQTTGSTPDRGFDNRPTSSIACLLAAARGSSAELAKRASCGMIGPCHGGLAFVALSALLALSAAPADAARQKPIRGKLTATGYTLIALVDERQGHHEASEEWPVLAATAGACRDPAPTRPRRRLRRAGRRRNAQGRKARRRRRARRGAAAAGSTCCRTTASRARRANLRAARPIGVASPGPGRECPIGAGVFGWVRSKPPGRPPKGDRDFDGIPDRLDIDDDGDRVLDKVDRSRLRRGRSAAVTAEDPLGLATGLGVPLHATPNCAYGHERRRDRPGEPRPRLHHHGHSIRRLRGRARLRPARPGGAVVLRYWEAPPCTKTAKRFPECCDDDGDGFGTMDPTDVVPGDYQNFGFDHRSTSTQIGTGYYLFHHVTKSGDESQCPSDTDPDCVSYSAVQQFAFATTPALKSFDDGAGAAGDDPIPGRLQRSGQHARTTRSRWLHAAAATSSST